MAVGEDFQRLVGLAAPLVGAYADTGVEEWRSSPIGWIREIPSVHKRGKIGEELVRAWAQSEGLKVGGRGDRSHDCVIAGLRFEVKTSLRWSNDRFVFLGLRDFPYDAVALLGLEPHACRLWILPKDVVWINTYDQKLGAGGAGSKWFWARVNKPPAWLDTWGGTLGTARAALYEVARRQLYREWQTAEQHDWHISAATVTWPAPVQTVAR